ncbi:alpha/beta hydrolase [Streptomyces sp. NPDC097981]|uniref:alpha/beta hydrolase n=1 Tax=Streptomyces sp. NPDC097981 TaxID=3155428 RepID=UPI0033192E76
MNLKRLAPLFAAAGLLATTLPALSATQASAAEVEEYAPGKPSWQRCSPDQPAAFECATIKVPLDYRHPRGAMLAIALSRMKSENPAKRHGALLLNPGGPGASGLNRPLVMNRLMPGEVREQYDLIGFAPRGVGPSSPITCGMTPDEENEERPYKEETFQKDVAWARTVADKCREKSGPVLPFITTRNTARDMDAIRVALGEKKISYVGYSYGTYMGAVYTQMFPKRTDRFVLDSAVDPGRVWRGMTQVWATEAEPAFKRWTQWTAGRAAEYQLGDTPEAVAKTFWDIVARADRTPIVMGSQTLTGDDVRTARNLFFTPDQAAYIVRAMKRAADGTPTTLSAPEAELLKPAAEPAPQTPAEPSDNAMAVLWAVTCGDTDAWPRDPGQYAREAAQDKAKYPLYGDFASNIRPCAFWQPPAEPATPMNTKANVLTVQNEWDPQTPLVSGLGLHKALRGSRMVLAQGGEGHGVYLSYGGSCANEPVNAYLATGRLPEKDVTCRATPGGNEHRAELVAPSPQGFPALTPGKP